MYFLYLFLRFLQILKSFIHTHIYGMNIESYCPGKQRRLKGRGIKGMRESGQCIIYTCMEKIIKKGNLVKLEMQTEHFDS